MRKRRGHRHRQCISFARMRVRGRCGAAAVVLVADRCRRAAIRSAGNTSTKSSSICASTAPRRSSSTRRSPALVALRGVPLDPSASARLDRQAIRAMFEAAGCTVDNVGQPWRRKGRRFVQVRIDTTDVRTLSKCGLLVVVGLPLGRRRPDGCAITRSSARRPARDPGAGELGRHASSSRSSCTCRAASAFTT